MTNVLWCICYVKIERFRVAREWWDGLRNDVKTDNSDQVSTFCYLTAFREIKLSYILLQPPLYCLTFLTYSSYFYHPVSTDIFLWYVIHARKYLRSVNLYETKRRWFLVTSLFIGITLRHTKLSWEIDISRLFISNGTHYLRRIRPQLNRN